MRKIRQWIITLAAFLVLISGSFLLYQWWERKQNIAQIQEREQTNAYLEKIKAIQEYQKQQKDWKSIAILAKNPTIHQFFNDLLQGYAYRFAKEKNIADVYL